MKSFRYRRTPTMVGLIGVCTGLGMALFSLAQDGHEVHGAASSDSVGIGLSDSSIARRVDVEAMVLIPAGSFRMGTDLYDDEGPVHTVYIDSFYIDMYEVTNGQYGKFLEVMKKKESAEAKEPPPTPPQGMRGPPGRMPPPGMMGRGGPPKASHEPVFWSDTTFNKPDYPVVGVGWSDAQAYCAWAGKRLPTEAEWERAARGEDERIYPWGDDPPDENGAYRANYDPGKNIHGKKRDDGFDQTAPVGSFSEDVSPYGAYDMAGNVSEWVAERWALAYYSASPDSNPPGPQEGAYRVIRGGSWNAFGYYIRTSVRAWADSTSKVNYVGFRCVRCAKENAREQRGRGAGGAKASRGGPKRASSASDEGKREDRP